MEEGHKEEGREDVFNDMREGRYFHIVGGCAFMKASRVYTHVMDLMKH